MCFKTATDSSVRWLQFRILHRILPVGYYLRKINIKSLDNCGFCEKKVETIVHIFTTCDKIHTLWTELSLHIYRKTAVYVEFSLSNIIFSLMLKKLPTLIGFLCHFKVKFNVEKYAAIQSFKRMGCFEKYIGMIFLTITFIFIVFNIYLFIALFHTNFCYIILVKASNLVAYSIIVCDLITDSLVNS